MIQLVLVKESGEGQLCQHQLKLAKRHQMGSGWGVRVCQSHCQCL